VISIQTGIIVRHFNSCYNQLRYATIPRKRMT